jgi:uncharacterized protein YndB with AHSA1/START domain
MTLTDTTAKGQFEAITFEFELDHPPGKVWRALTEPELLTQWLLPVSEFELEPGAAFTFQAPPQPEWDGQVKCQLVEIEEGRKLSYRWLVGEMDIETVVTFTLTRSESGTHLAMEQSGFKPGQRQAFGGARYGWRMMGEKLVELLGSLASS